MPEKPRKAHCAARERPRRMPDELRAAIREILREELAKAGADKAKAERRIAEERVKIESDEDLMKFARRLLALYSDPGSRQAIENGRHVFKLGERGASMPRDRSDRAAEPMRDLKAARFESGLITEKTIRSLPDSTALVRAEKAVKFTPLALEALRRAGIKLERTKT